MARDLRKPVCCMRPPVLASPSANDSVPLPASCVPLLRAQKSSKSRCKSRIFPNGDVAASEHDKVLTRAIVLAVETVQLRILDHLIVSAQDVFSFRRAGLL